MKLSHIHENEEHKGSLADWFNKNKIYPRKMYGNEAIELQAAGEKIETKGMFRASGEGDAVSRFSNRHRIPKSSIELTSDLLSWWDLQDVLNQGLKTIGYELIEHEPIPEPDNPLDNIKDEYGGESPAMFAAVLEGSGEFEGQFAWYNEDLISYKQICGSPYEYAPLVKTWGRPRGLCWEEGRPPKLPAK